MQFVEDDITSAKILELLRLHAEDMLAKSPPGACHFLDLEGLRAPNVTFWSIWDDESLAGCGGLLELDSGHGEVKSMRTAEHHRGKGVGRSMLEHIVDVARSRGYERISLETGSGVAFEAAEHLYQRFGFQACEPFAGYSSSEFSRFYTLLLR